MKNILLLALTFYKKFISYPLFLFLGRACRFTPTCSEYTRKAILKFGVFKGLSLAIKRIVNCHPFSRRLSFDPIP